MEDSGLRRGTDAGAPDRVTGSDAPASVLRMVHEEPAQRHVGVPGQLGFDDRLVSDQDDLDVVVHLLQGADRAGDFSRRRVIGAHRIQDDAHLALDYSDSISRTASPR